MHTLLRQFIARLRLKRGPPAAPAIVVGIILTLAWPLVGNATEGDKKITVKGTIPSGPCTAVLSNSGTVDYGMIPTAGLTKGAPKKLPTRQLNLAIKCSASAKMALIFTDNQAASRLPGITGEATDAYNYGLGMVDGKKVGGFSLSLDKSSTADGVEIRNIFSDDKGATWKRGARYLQHAGHWFSFGDGKLSPVGFVQIRAHINVDATINNLELLPTNQEVPLRGAATIEMRYL